MRIVQQNFVENSIASSAVQTIGFAMLFFVPKTIQFHPAKSPIVIAIFSIITIAKLFMIFFSKGRKIENAITFALIIMSGALWSTILLIELLAQPVLNPLIIVILIFLTMVNSAASFVLYKRPCLSIIYLIVLPGLSTLYIFIFLTEMNIIIGSFMLIGTFFLAVYEKTYYRSWKNFLIAKEKNEVQAKELEQIKIAIDNTSDAVSIFSHNGEHFYQNKAFTKMFGYSEHEAVKLRPKDLFKDIYDAKKVFSTIMAGNKCAMEIEMVSKTGQNFPVDFRANAIKIEKGKILSVISIYTDITQRKKAEEQQLEAQNFQARILDTAATAVFTIDTDQIITSVNREFSSLTGFSEEESIGKHCHFLRWMPRSDDCSLYNGKHIEPILHKQSTILTKDNKKLTIIKNATLLHDKDGNIAGGIESFIDVTELVKARELAEEMNDQLEKAVARANQMAMEAEMANIAKSEFLANMSHEIRTPMNGVIGMTHLLLSTPLNEEQKEFTETIQNSGEALLSIINDILDYSKIEAGKYELENIDFDLRLTMDKLNDLVSIKAHEKALEFICIIDYQIPSLLIGDPGRLRQILINLTGNAIKFTDQGEIVIRVSLKRAEANSVTLKFTVSDTGIGIPEDRINTIFHSFSQADSSTTRKYGGTGLGLTISKQLAEMMGGKMDVTSEQGKGSQFWFTADFKKQKGNALTTRANTLQKTQNQRVLIVDDNTTSRSYLKEQLKLWGYSYDEASNGFEALEKLKIAMTQNNTFKIAIIDMHMPGMDGKTLGKKIKQNPDLQKTNLVLMTSMGTRGDAKLLKKIGFAAYLTKPVKLSRLSECLALVSDIKEQNKLKQNKKIITQHSLAEECKNNMRILIAEDNPINQKVAMATLKKLGYHADIVSNGNQVLKALSESQYDIIIMDCQMPEMDGYTATQKIRTMAADSKIKNIPIIAMTANAMEGDKKKCIDAGMNDYLTKPVKPQVLSDMLQKWLLK